MTSEVTDSSVRQISLRSVHGKYLIRLLDKAALLQARSFPQHGTLVRLKLRRAANTSDLLHALRQWVVMPGCSVTFQADEQAPIVIGYASPKDALSAYLEGRVKDRYRVNQAERSGVQVAYAMTWSETFREWTLVGSNSPDLQGVPPGLPPGACTCVQGIAVEFVTPGFRSPTLLCIANCTGTASPKTNVARTALEDTAESLALWELVYDVFKDAVTNEVARMRTEEGMTLTKATNETPFIATPLRGQGSARDSITLHKKLNEIAVCMLEGHEGSVREARTVEQLEAFDEFWTVESEAVRSAENLLGQFSSDSSIHAAVESLSNKKVILPKPILCNINSLSVYQEDIFEKFEITLVRAYQDQQRLDFRWQKRTGGCCLDTDSIYRRLPSLPDSRIRGLVQRALSTRMGMHPGPGSQVSARVWIGLEGLCVHGLDEFGAVRAYQRIIVLPSEPIASLLKEIVSSAPTSIAAYVYPIVAHRIFRQATMGGASEQEIGRMLQQIEAEVPGFHLERKSEFVAAMGQSKLRTYDPMVWSHRAWIQQTELWS
jgi:molecular chaperone HtpG